jgi:ornithine--oxo-acid transaminase
MDIYGRGAAAGSGHTRAAVSRISIIGVASGLGAIDRGCTFGPDALQRHGLAHALSDDRHQASWHAFLRARPVSSEPEKLLTIKVLCGDLAEHVSAAVQRNDRFAVIGGDHACAIGTWTGAYSALRTQGPLGLVWIDAHMDSHTPRTTPSGAVHGMPLAALLGHGHSAFTELRLSEAKVLPNHICLLGVRSFESGEAQLLKRLGVRVIFMDEIRERGLRSAFDEAMHIACSGTAGFGISIDLDAIDPTAAPGVGSPVPGGLYGDELIECLAQLTDHEGLLGIEVAELNPTRDVQGQTASLAIDLLQAGLTGRRKRTRKRHRGSQGMTHAMDLEQRYCAHNYAPLPVVLTRGQGVYLWDELGRRYIDMMSAYSAVSHGHAHPRLVQTLTQQASQLAVVSRAFHSDRLGAFVHRACELTGMDVALPMNTGAEAVETALKAARKWAYEVKGVAKDRAEIIVCDNNFHGRTIAIVGFSSHGHYRGGFGPFPPGFKSIPFGDSDALEQAITPQTAAFLVEPIQGEGGIVVPPAGYLARCAEICRKHNVLLLADEIQTGLGRTGRLLACDHDGVKPDGLILGKALGGGLLPVSMFLARSDVLDVFQPGDHGSTFGGNPLAAAVGLEALNVLVDQGLIENTARQGEYLLRKLRALASPLVREVRGRGLLIGVELEQARISGRVACEELAARGVLTCATRESIIRFAPPLIITREQVDEALEQISQTFSALDKPTGVLTASGAG